MNGKLRIMGVPPVDLTRKETGVPDIDRLTDPAFTAFKQRGMTDYTKETIREIYLQSR